MSKKQWFQNLTGGINQSVDSNLADNNQTTFLKNITLGKVGNWMTRKGTSLFCNRVNTSDEVWGLFSYDSYSNTTGVVTHQMGMVTDRDLYLSNVTDTTFVQVASDKWTSNKRVRGINFLNSIYLGCDDFTTPVSYSIGGTTTNITPGIPGGYLATNKHILAIGGNAYLKNTIFFSDAYTSNFSSANFTVDAASTAKTLVGPAGTFKADTVGSIVFNITDLKMAKIISWTSATTVVLDTTIGDTWDGDTVYILSNIYEHTTPVTAIIGYGDGFVSFDEDTMAVWNPFSKASDKLPGAGCVNHDTLKSLGGNLIWVNRSGVYLWSGTGRPQDISKYLKDTEDGFGIWDLLTTANFETMSAGVDESNGYYYLSIGDLQTITGAPASAITNAVLIFDINKGEWEFCSYNREPFCFTNFINKDGSRNLYFGEKDAAAVYKTNTGTTDAVGDGTTATISFELRTKTHILGGTSVTLADQTVAKRIRSYIIKYVSANDATLYASADGEDFIEQATLPASSTKIKTQTVKPTKQVEGILHSLKITGTGKFVLKGYGFTFDELTTDRQTNI